MTPVKVVERDGKYVLQTMFGNTQFGRAPAAELEDGRHWLARRDRGF